MKATGISLFNPGKGSPIIIKKVHYTCKIHAFYKLEEKKKKQYTINLPQPVRFY